MRARQIGKILIRNVNIFENSFMHTLGQMDQVKIKSNTLKKITGCRYHVSDKWSRTHKQIISQTWHYSDVAVQNSFGFEHFHILYTKYSIQHI